MDQRDSTVQRNRRQRTMPDVLPIVAEVEVPTVEDFFNIYEGQLDKLKVTLRTVTKVVGAAEQKQFTDRDVREWLHDLKDAAFRAEDFLDKVAYEVLKLKIESGGAQTSANAEMQTQNCTGQVRQFLPCFNLCRKGMSVGKVESRLKEIHETLEHLLKQMGHLGLEEKNSTREERSQKLDATSLVDTSSVYGRDGDAVSSMVYEASARIRDPVYGCVGAICQLQKQVNELQAQLAKSQAELVNMQHQQANLVALLCMEITSPSPPPHHNHQQHSPLSHDDTMDNVMMITSTPQFYPTTNPNWLLDETFLGSTWEEPLWT